MPCTNNMKKLTCFILFLLSITHAFPQATAQPGDSVPMADEMYKSGKIYVVIVTIAIVFIGLAVYLFNMDRRLRRLEKDKDI